MNYYLLIICCRTADAVLRSNTLGAHQRAAPNRLPTHSHTHTHASLSAFLTPTLSTRTHRVPTRQTICRLFALCVTLFHVSPHPSISPLPVQKRPCFTETFQTSPGLTSGLARGRAWMNESGQPVRGAESCCVLLIAARRRSDESGRQCAGGGGVCRAYLIFPLVFV